MLFDRVLVSIDSEKGATPIVDLVQREPREELNGVFFFLPNMKPRLYDF